jgi:hypothetical protein
MITNTRKILWGSGECLIIVPQSMIELPFNIPVNDFLEHIKMSYNLFSKVHL